ncbi:MAG TPA: hypothetical protein PK760_02140 [Flavobacteriales bacterium]|nr:hypothetical protein [Flavobacteriales bacterium]
MSNQSDYTKCALATALVLILAACGGAEEPSTTTNTDSANVDRGLLARAALVVMDTASGSGTEHPYVGIAEYNCVTSDFGYHIHQGVAGSHGSISTFGSALSIRVSELQRVVKEMPPCTDAGPVQHAVIVRYGLNKDFALSAALQVLCLSYDTTTKEYSYPVSSDCYLIGSDANLTFTDKGLDTWYDTNGDGDTYAERVFIRSKDPGNTWAPYTYDVDVRATVFPYEGRIDSLIANNDMTGDDLLELVPMAVPRTRSASGGGYIEEGYHQSMLWVPSNVIIDDVFIASASFKNKAADLGTACPFTCPTELFKFLDQGLPPRGDCKP